MSAPSIKQSIFLQAEWRKLLMANYVISPALLKNHVPKGTELDLWEDRCYISLVGFMFINTQIRGLSIPWHRNFEEVNLRFYVRRKIRGEWRRGVVFIKEIVPKPAISWVANTLYGERYVTRRMRHVWNGGISPSVTYSWKPYGGRTWNELSAVYNPLAQNITPGSEAEFITEHYWGYSGHGNRTMEYEVGHPRWEVYTVEKFGLHGALEQEYGAELAAVLAETPNSVFLAEGSAIKILKGGWMPVD